MKYRVCAKCHRRIPPGVVMVAVDGGIAHAICPAAVDPHGVPSLNLQLRPPPPSAA
jgi:hypothetical protein